MKFCQPLEGGAVLRAALRLVRLAKSEILVTMDVDEEEKEPLASAYLQALEAKCKSGVIVKRLGFGSKRAFRLISRQYGAPNLIFIYGGGITRYQRMLVVDREKALSRVGNQVILTDFAPLVRSLVNYFEIVYHKEGK